LIYWYHAFEKRKRWDTQPRLSHALPQPTDIRSAVAGFLVDQGMATESAIFAERPRSAEAREAFRALAERRPPDFSKLAG
jgi:hypothetical protein